ncbi:MAG: biotin carboxylase N-terminal domain-containing protein, partial [Pseudomonadales bacterium]
QHYLDLADDTVCISASSYLDIPTIVSAAKIHGCDAVHPGYGMLAENPTFAGSLEDSGITLVGPCSEHIALMGDKVSARQAARDLGLNTIPGSSEKVCDLQSARSIASSFGYPLLLKAAFGGGGRGMRQVKDEADLDRQFHEAASEAQASFGDGALYIEKWFSDVRHVEVQILGDGKGHAIHLGTRDCSIQRQYQKIIEEAPAPGIAPKLLDSIAELCAGAAAKMKYRSAGTFEFLFTGDEFYFIEMNTRLQVEHPVTEVVTGVDLVKSQLKIAMAEALDIHQSEVSINGHAIECRINAEKVNLQTGTTTPSPGLVTELISPGGPGIRWDSHLTGRHLVPHQYDSLVAKLIGSGASRDEAIVRTIRGLSETRIRGIDTNLELLSRILVSPSYKVGNLSTEFISEMRKSL